MPDDCDEIPSPVTLKEALEFLVALNDNSNLKKQVGKQLKEKAEEHFFALNYLNEISSLLENTFGKIRNLRSNIVQSNSLNDDGKNNEVKHKSHFTERCIQIFLHLLPQLHNTLLYLYFNVDEGFRYWGGGEWNLLHCDGSRDSGNLKNKLSNWLQDRSILPSGYASSAKLLPGGYNRGELSSRPGRELANSLRSLLGNMNTTGGPLKNLVFQLLLLRDWYASDTAAVIMFIKAFCEAVTAKQDIFGHKLNRYPRLQHVCKNLAENLSLITGNSASASLLVAMCQEGGETYAQLLKADAFDDYVNELKTKLGVISNALMSVSSDCRSWNKNTLKTASYSGPFSYGFMFGEAWKNESHDFKNQLRDAINKLLVKGSGDKGSLQDLIEALTLTSGSPGQGPGSAQYHGSSEPGSDGPRTLGTSGTLSASVSSAGSSATATAAHHSTHSEVTTPASTGAGGGVDNIAEQTSHGNDGHPGGTPDVTSEASVSSDSTITIGSAGGGVALLGGGGAALYFLKVGGIKTLITGVP
ncbi:secreted antigen 1 [Babesia caballi]|uniref:Secreted antigen 1 n=1 Tax=Babesia caballi TaxID=5871 RepID=A0AAV4LQ91_BABCB|nr:secreted antigen 1 [Babesia caballi]